MRAVSQAPDTPGESSAAQRREAHTGALVYYTPEEVEALARALADCEHREDAERSSVETAEDMQDAELVRVAAYAGLRSGARPLRRA